MNTTCRSKEDRTRGDRKKCGGGARRKVGKMDRNEHTFLPLKTGTPLLVYPLWTKRNFLGWLKDGPMYIGLLSGQGKDCYPTLVKLLLAAGADPNECFHGHTPWSMVMDRIYSRLDRDFPLLRFGPPASVTWPERSFLDKLEVAKLMLEHGADPFLSIDGHWSDGYTVSPQIFAELLERECCSGNAFKDCICAYARQIEPMLTELVEMVEWRRYFKQQKRNDGELLIQGAWLIIILAYILQSYLTSSS